VSVGADCATASGPRAQLLDERTVMAAEVAIAVVKRLLHRAGLRADVLSSGVIARGAKLTPGA